MDNVREHAAYYGIPGQTDGETDDQVRRRAAADGQDWHIYSMRMSSTLRGQIERAAAANDQSAAGFVRMAVKRELERHGRP